MPNEPISGDARDVVALHAIHDAVEAERIALAGKLHNEPLQELAGVGFQLERIMMALERGDVGPAAEIAADAADHLRRQIDALREMMAELRAPQPDRIDLNSAVQALAARVRNAPNGAPTVDLDLGDVTINAISTVAIYRIVQDALSSMLAATPRPATIRLTIGQERSVLRVTAGCDRHLEATALLDATSSSALPIRDRVAMLGGTAMVTTSDNPSETTLSITAPTVPDAFEVQA